MFPLVKINLFLASANSGVSLSAFLAYEPIRAIPAPIKKANRQLKEVIEEVAKLATFYFFQDYCFNHSRQECLDILNILKENERTHEDNAYALYLFLEYGRDDLFESLEKAIPQNLQHKTKAPLTYLANILCQISDFDKLEKLTTNYKDSININSTGINNKKIVAPCLLQLIKNKNFDMAKKLINEYEDEQVNPEAEGSEGDLDDDQVA